VQLCSSTIRLQDHFRGRARIIWKKSVRENGSTRIHPRKGYWKGLIAVDARLKILSGLLLGQPVRLPRKLLIGRAEDCDLRVESDFVSTYHCVLLLDDYTLRLRDLASKNGTFVNGRRVDASTVILLHDDSVSIGDINLLIELTPRTPETETASSQPQSESSSNRLDGTVLSDGDTVRADGAETIPPPPVSRPALPNVSSPASRPVGPPLRQEGGNG
jgi:predicted component of type VI protein secretion system